MFELTVTSSAKRIIKKLPRMVREKLILSSNALTTNPFAGEKLSGSLHFLHSLHFSSGGVQYRAVYTVDEQERQVIIHYVGSRENFYEKVKRLFR
jgi:mRNA-degrading endonuclease RelE of RelBE toxin-antitoxin system